MEWGFDVYTRRSVSLLVVGILADKRVLIL